jgi:hypothetical protein
LKLLGTPVLALFVMGLVLFVIALAVFNRRGMASK